MTTTGRKLAIFGPMMAAALLSGCSLFGNGPVRIYSSSYVAVEDGGYQLPTIPQHKVPKKYHRSLVNFETTEEPGTIIVNTAEKYAYLVLEGGKAMRYGIGVGREGFGWNGIATIARKADWPTWTPPAEMIERQPELAKYRGGQKPGLDNPLGARALYLFQDGRDTGYRLHGSPEWWSIGGNVSSGCIRLMNQDIIDLYERAEVGAKVIVI